jgi:ribosomal protein L37E
MGKKNTELERTCLRDGTVWYVQPQTIKRPKGAGWATPLAGRKRAELNANLAVIDQARRQAGTCPTCGSTSYTERTVKTS